MSANAGSGSKRARLPSESVLSIPQSSIFGGGSMATKKKKPYAARTDLQKLRSQWNKLDGLHGRREWSAAVVRAATAAEVAVNIAIRKEMKSRSKLDASFVDSLLIWANGITGKMSKLLIPLTKKRKYAKGITDLVKLVEAINKKRNSIVHSGEFCGTKEAREVIRKSREFIIALMRLYNKNFALRDPER